MGVQGAKPLAGVVEDVPPASVAPCEECKRERIAYIKLRLARGEKGQLRSVLRQASLSGKTA